MQLRSEYMYGESGIYRFQNYHCSFINLSGIFCEGLHVLCVSRSSRLSKQQNHCSRSILGRMIDEGIQCRALWHTRNVSIEQYANRKILCFHDMCGAGTHNISTICAFSCMEAHSLHGGNHCLSMVHIRYLASSP